PARKKSLLKRFGSLARVREADPEQIAETPGIGSDLAAAIHEHLHTQPTSDRRATA
ncbi:MAG: hypothetical protein E6G63_04190, partial [Actinobacteria bacterium]